MRELIKYEYKKIFQRRSTWISLIVAVIWILFSGISGVLGDYYVDGEKEGSRLSKVRKERAALEEMTGQKLDEAFFREAGNQGREQEKYSQLYVLYAMMAGQIGEVELEKSNEMDFYEYRSQMLEKIFQKEKLSAGEAAFHRKEGEQVKIPYDYGNMLGFDQYFRIQGTNGAILAFVIAICLAPIFSLEYSSHMDSLILSSRFGKNKVIQAKLITGISFALLFTLLLFGIFFLEIKGVYGLSGWNLPVQVSASGFYLSIPINLLEMLVISTVCCLAASCMTAVFVMFCSSRMNTPFGVIIISFIFIFLPEILILAVAEYRSLFMVVNSMPTSMMHASGVIADQLFAVGNHYFYFFQFVPVVYVLLILPLTMWIRRSFRNHQIIS